MISNTHTHTHSRMPVKSNNQSPKKVKTNAKTKPRAERASPRKITRSTPKRVGRFLIRQRAGGESQSNTNALDYPYLEDVGYKASDECGELLLKHVKQFLAEMTASGGESGDPERDFGNELRFKDRLIILLSENKLTLSLAGVISRVLREIAKLPFPRH